mmetsp:Transcript_30125/g.42358  ORF Transcript_30125/g.42358 Transcript_30125/m.42358 type:complete len:291 (-) Transcript_30125:50-922(-)
MSGKEQRQENTDCPRISNEGVCNKPNCRYRHKWDRFPFNIALCSNWMVNGVCSFSCSSQHPHFTKHPQIAVFWDVENCGVPSKVNDLKILGKLSLGEILKIKCIGQVEQISKTKLLQLYQQNIEFHHVPCTGKANESDDNIKRQMLEFCRTHPSGKHTIVLISGDIDFKLTLQTIRQEYPDIMILLFHNRQAKGELKDVAHCYCGWEEILTSKKQALLNYRRAIASSWYSSKYTPQEVQHIPVSPNSDPPYCSITEANQRDETSAQLESLFWMGVAATTTVLGWYLFKRK